MGNRGKDVQAGGYDKWLAVAGLLVVMWLPAGVWASVEEEYFNSGVTAARQQDHAAALRHFEAAERGGMRQPLLYYNLGVSYYHEGRLDKAESAFHLAARSPKLAALSYYNLGLIARDRGQLDQAIDRFEQAGTVAQTPEMRRLSDIALSQMRGESPEDAAASWLLWAEGGISYDSNPALATDFITTTDAGSDQSLNFSAYGQYDFTRLRLHALASASHFSDMDDLNFDLLETGLSLPLNSGSWKFRPGLNLRHIRLGDESLQDSTVLWLESRTPAAEGSGLKFYLEHEAINAASGYGHLQGTRDYFQTSLSMLEDRWRLVWDLEFNDRADMSVATGDFSSFSPRRRQWQLEYRDSLTAAIDLRLAAGLQNSHYANPEIRGGAVIQSRKDTRERLILELGYEHGNDWRSKLELTYLQRNSNFAEFEYDRSVLTLGMERSFSQ
jgi:tetratricopeptide (TPR) repeat protein